MQNFALEVGSQQSPAFLERRAHPCGLVWLLLFGTTAQSGGRHFVGRQYVGRHLLAQSEPPDSLDHHQPKLWEDGGQEGLVEQMIHKCETGRATALGSCCPLVIVVLCVLLSLS